LKKVGVILTLFALLLWDNISSIKATESLDCRQSSVVDKVYWDGVELKVGQIGRLTVLHNTSLFKLDGDKKVFTRTLNKGEIYRIYAFKPGMLSVGGGYYVDRDSKVKYETPSKAKLEAVTRIKVETVRDLSHCTLQDEKASKPILVYPNLSFTSSNLLSSLKESEDYSYINWFYPSKRYIFKDHLGRINILNADYENIKILHFDHLFNKSGETMVQKESLNFGGFHEGNDGYYYILYGQGNYEESNIKPVYRLVKYDNRWKKIAQLDIKDVYVAQPFDGSNVTMDSYNGKLVIHSARLRYKTDDGLRHQSNISFLVDMKNMILINNGGQWPANHVSHSFATYVRFDGEDTVYVDHGDAYPRAIVLQVERENEITRQVDLISFPGRIGDNYTGASLGGLEVSQSNYLVISAYKQNVILSVVPKKTDSQPKLLQISNDNTKASINIEETHISKINDNKFVILWVEENMSTNYNKDLYYAVVNGNGELIQKPKKLLGVPSPGNISPLVQGNSLIWYYSSPIYNLKEDKYSLEFFTLNID